MILLSVVEIDSSLRRRITVVKAPGRPHEFDRREYVIAQSGITLMPFDEDVAIAALRAAGCSGILSRPPNRMPRSTGTLAVQ
jgi:hypothetical protein